MECICTEAALLNDGKIAMQGTIAELLSKRSSDGFVVEAEQEGAADTLVKAFGDFRRRSQNALVFHGSEDRFFVVMQYVAENRIPVQKIERIEPTLTKKRCSLQIMHKDAFGWRPSNS